MGTRVLLDANTLVPRTIRDWLFLLKLETGGVLFQLVYTEDIMAEAVRALRRAYPDIDGAALTTVADRMRDSFDDRVSDYRSGSDASFIRDEFDRHVHAAAVAGQVDLLVTSDSGFLRLPQEVLDGLDYEIHTPDEFLTLVDDSAPRAVRLVVRGQIDYCHRRGDVEIDLPQRLRESQCPDFADRILRHQQQLALE